MISEIFPFWVKYWQYVMLIVMFYIIFHIFSKKIIKSAAYENVNHEFHEEDISKTFQDEASFDNSALPKDLQHILFAYKKPSERDMREQSLNFYNIANARRTLRFFSSEPVPRDILHNIIKAAGTAPSGAHTEPWIFVLVSNPDVKMEVREIVEKEEELNYKKRMGKKWTTDLKPLKTNWIKEYLTDAPYLICLFKQTYGIASDGHKINHYYNEMSVSIAAGILITAIQFAGLVTLTSTPLNCGPALRKLFNRPSNEKLVLLLPIGYPAPNATVPDLRRKSLNEILVEI